MANDKYSDEETWHCGYLMEEGEKVSLLRPLRIWRYSKIGSLFRNKGWETEHQIVEAGAIGTITGKDNRLNSVTYNVAFGEINVESIPDFCLAILNGEQHG